MVTIVGISGSLRKHSLCMASSMSRIRNSGMVRETHVGQRCHEEIRRRGPLPGA